MNLQFFHYGQKEIIIKSVVTALLHHVISCYRLLKTVKKKLTSVVAQYLWSLEGSTRGMHCNSWDIIIM